MQGTCVSQIGCYAAGMETTPKKEASFAELLITFWLSSWFSLPLIVFLVIVVPAAFFVPEPFLTGLVVVVGLVTLWFSPRFGAHYINKRYVVPDHAKILKWTLIWNVVFSALGIVLAVNSFVELAYTFPVAMLAMDVVYNVLTVVVIYYASKRALLGTY